MNWNQILNQTICIRNKRVQKSVGVYDKLVQLQLESNHDMATSETLHVYLQWVFKMYG